jgi:outer membrane protein assembly factor BamB
VRDYPHKRRLRESRGQNDRMLASKLVPLAASAAVAAAAVLPPPAAGSTASATTLQATASSDWPTYHHDAGRSGSAPNFPTPTSSTAVRRSWSVTLGGVVDAQPLYVGGTVVVATEGNSVYALDPATGRTRWRTNIGAPLPAGSVPCGNSRQGIMSTPVYDASTGTVYVIGRVTGKSWVFAGLSLSNGAVRVRRTVTTPAGDAAAAKQRGALTLLRGRVYASFGSVFGDCGNYIGSVIGIPTGTGSIVSWSVPTSHQAGIWQPAGATVDARGNLLYSVGNGATSGAYDGSDSVVALSPALHRVDFFAPSTWQDDNVRDYDLGSMGPMIVPNGRVLISGKRGVAYLLSDASLGGIGGQLASAPSCGGYGGSARRNSTVYIACRDGIAALQVGSGDTVAQAWKKPAPAYGPPVAGGGRIWSIDLSSHTLYVLDPTTGAVRAKALVPVAVPHFSSPTLAGGRVFVNTTTGVTAFSVN